MEYNTLQQTANLSQIRVRRKDLYEDNSSLSSFSSSSSSLHHHYHRKNKNEEEAEKARAELNARLSSLLAVQPLDSSSSSVSRVEASSASTPGRRWDGDTLAGDEEEEFFSFRLFSTSAPTQKVALVADHEKPHQGPAISRRPIEHYIRGELSLEQVEAFRLAAVSAGDVVAGARSRAWGLEVPWRVKTVVLTPGEKGLVKVLKRHGGSGSEGGGEVLGTGRKRPGKKRRIALRTKEKASKEAAKAAEAQKMTKEEHLREKKKRLNREKKLKRRQKEREKKLAGKGGEEDGGDQSDEEDSE